MDQVKLGFCPSYLQNVLMVFQFIITYKISIACKSCGHCRTGLHVTPPVPYFPGTDFQGGTSQQSNEVYKFRRYIVVESPSIKPGYTNKINGHHHWITYVHSVQI